MVQPPHRARNAFGESLDQGLDNSICVIKISYRIYLKTVLAVPAVATFSYWCDLKLLSHLVEG